jgi:hypothetical protein
MKQREQRRQDGKRLAMAKIKATEKPFSFQEKDHQHQVKKQEKAELDKDVPQFPQFRAAKVPWRVQVPLFQSIMDADGEKRKNVKKVAEINLQLSKLPPRMESHKKTEKEKKQADNRKAEAMFRKSYTFKPLPAREVPDFRRLHKEFASTLNRNKSAAKLTNPVPFHFHEPKNRVDLRKHMDEENQKIQPTMKKRASSARIFSLNADIEENRVNPPTTLKHEALVKLRRETKIQKLTEKQIKDQEDNFREYKKSRLTNRVKKSPALASNTALLRKKRQNGLQRAKDEMRYLEDVYNQQKALMEFNVANRPLLVEQQTQEFINLYNQIKDLQKYVAILRNANLNPNDHLTEDQKILLQRAQYFDQLNQLAYFPNGVPPSSDGLTVLDEAQQQQLMMLQAQQQ